MEVQNSITQRESEKSIPLIPSIPSSKISRLLIAVSTVALSIIGSCGKAPKNGSHNMKPTLHLSCASHGNSLERTNQVNNIANIKLTRDMKGTDCSYSTEDMKETGNQVPVTVFCNPKKENKGIISKEIDGVEIKVTQSDAICEIINQ